MKGKKLAIAAVFFCLLLLLTSLSACGTRENSFGDFAMGSLLQAKIYADQTDADALWQSLDAKIKELDANISATDRDSVLSRLNESGSASVPPDVFTLLRRAREICVDAGGSLDITLGAATALWGFTGETPHVPDADALAAAVQTAGTDHLQLEEAALQVTLTDGAKLDLGAVGKGAGADLALASLQTGGKPAVVNFGGTVLLYGRPAGRTSWTVGLRDPFGDEASVFAVCALSPRTKDGAVFISTSGSYEKQFTENGKTYHHILDPATGAPVETSLAGVTVVSGSGLVSDALSTACFVKGLGAESLSLLKKYEAAAVFVFTDGRVYITPELRSAVRITAEGFTQTNDEGT